MNEYWTVAPRGMMGLGSCELLVTIFSSTDLYITSCYACLLESTLFNILCGFINVKVTVNSIKTHDWMKLIQHTYFLWKGCHSLLALRNTTNISALCSRAILTSKMTNKKYTSANMALSLEKDTCLLCESWNEKAEHYLVWPGLGICTEGNSHFSPLWHGHAMDGYGRTGLGVTDKFQWVGKFASIESASNKHQLCLFTCWTF